MVQTYFFFLVFCALFCFGLGDFFVLDGGLRLALSLLTAESPVSGAALGDFFLPLTPLLLPLGVLLP